MLDLSRVVDAWPELSRGGLVTVQLFLCCVAVSLTVGTASAMLQVSRIPGGYWLSRIYVSAMRGTPLLVQLFVVFFTLPLIGIRNQAFLAAVIAIGLNSGAFVTEILRASVLNVPRGHVEAAEAIGMSSAQVWARVILPQAFVTSLPALASEFTILLKATPLASVIAVTELTYAGQLVVARTFQPTEVLLAVTLGYIAVALCFTQLARWLERRCAVFLP
ncbi:MAG: amino acid ABC transporter permease [Gammaproteobacteria bacterium]